jgi:hypothetical protein
MTRREHLSYCSICVNQARSWEFGIICSLTSQKADFTDTCKDFQVDFNAKEKLIKESKHYLYENNLVFDYTSEIASGVINPECQSEFRHSKGHNLFLLIMFSFGIVVLTYLLITTGANDPLASFVVAALLILLR